MVVSHLKVTSEFNNYRLEPTAITSRSFTFSENEKVYVEHFDEQRGEAIVTANNDKWLCKISVTALVITSASLSSLIESLVLMTNTGFLAVWIFSLRDRVMSILVVPQPRAEELKF